MIHIAHLLDPDLSASSIVVASGVRKAGKTIDMRKNGRLRNGILYVQRGSVQFSPIDGEALLAHRGDVVLIPQGQRYITRYMEDDTTFILVNFVLFSTSMPTIPMADQICILSSGKPSIAEMFLRLEASAAEDVPSNSLRVKSDFFLLCAELLSDGVPSAGIVRKPKFANIVPGVTMLQQRYLENIPIPVFAQACSISLSSFRELFTEQYGLSPIQYRNQLRIKRATYLLSTGNYTVAETAYAVGFNHVGYFCRCYKKLTGESPHRTFLHDS